MIKLVEVYKEYSIGDDIFTALKNISLSIKKGEFISILGPSGSGKSTLMHIVGLLDKPTRGKVLVERKDTLKLSDDEVSKLRNTFVGFVFQQFNLINKMTVLENVLLPTTYPRAPLDFNPEKRAMTLMRRFGIDQKASSSPNKISGGEQQRVAITRALMMNPQIILADEPTGNLDTKTGEKILDLLDELNKKDKITIVIVTHEKHVADRTQRKIRIRDGEILK